VVGQFKAIHKKAKRFDMTGLIKILVKCFACGKSLMNSDVMIDYFPLIDIETKIGKKVGHFYLSQI
jgi:hypothetical protein